MGLASIILGAALTAGQPATEPEILVTGEPPREEAVQSFIREITREGRGHQLARWEGPVCPFVTGLSADHDRYIAATITAVAEAVGAEAGGQGCGVNLVVIVTADPVELIALLRDEQPLLFDSLNPPDRRQLLEGDDPVRVWSIVSTRGSDGRMAFRRMDSNGARPAMGVPGNARTEYLFGVEPSRIVRSTRLDIGATFIVLDAARLAGLNLQQISGFVSMLSLAQLDIDDPVTPARSILNLFHASRSPPQDLSDWDIAFLRALYASDYRRGASAQRGQMTRLMREALAEEER